MYIFNKKYNIRILFILVLLISSITNTYADMLGGINKENINNKELDIKIYNIEYINNISNIFNDYYEYNINYDSFLYNINKIEENLLKNIDKYENFEHINIYIGNLHNYIKIVKEKASNVEKQRMLIYDEIYLNIHNYLSIYIDRLDIETLVIINSNFIENQKKDISEFDKIKHKVIIDIINQKIKEKTK